MGANLTGGEGAVGAPFAIGDGRRWEEKGRELVERVNFGEEREKMVKPRGERVVKRTKRPQRAESRAERRGTRVERSE